MNTFKSIWNWNRTIRLYQNDCLVNRKDLEIAYITGCMFYVVVIIGLSAVIYWMF